MVKVDLACGDRKKSEDYIGVDIAKTEAVDIIHDLNIFPWPFEDNSVDEVFCSHYIEHIPHKDAYSEIKSVLNKCTSFEEFKRAFLDKGPEKDGLIKFFDELYRILKPGGKAELIAPYYTSVRSFGDPTHERFISDWTPLYINKQWREQNKLSHYGIESNFDTNYYFHVDSEIALKSKEVQEEAFKHNWNIVNDIVLKLIKV